MNTGGNASRTNFNRGGTHTPKGREGAVKWTDDDGGRVTKRVSGSVQVFTSVSADRVNPPARANRRLRGAGRPPGGGGM